MSNDETKLYDEVGAVAEAGADGVQAGLDARGVGSSLLSSRFGMPQRRPFDSRILLPPTPPPSTHLHTSA